MVKTLTVTFDGQVFHPETPVDLEPNTRYVITIESDLQDSEKGDVWDLLESLSGTLDAPADWASEHDHYLYGAPKRQSGHKNE
jgi:hypothetical protein